MYFTKRILALALAVLLVIPCAFAVSAAAEGESTLGAAAACTGHTLGTFSGLPACVNADGELHLCENNFPDRKFAEHLKGEYWISHYYLEPVWVKYDKDANGYLSISECDAVEIIDCCNESIESLRGIEFFNDLNLLCCSYNTLTVFDISKNVKLTYLFCSNNQLTSLDVSNNAVLSSLDCGSNQLTSLDVSNNAALSSLSCDSNKLTSLDVSNNAALSGLYCDSNQLTSLDVSNNAALSGLSCGSNQLTALDVSKNTKLVYLYCGDNALKSLDVSNNTALSELSCGSNQLTSLDVSNNTALSELFCGNNQLTALDVSKNTKLVYLYCGDNALKSLDVSKNAALINLHCDRQKVKTDKSSAKYFDMQGLIPEECLSKVSIDSNIGTYNPEAGMIVFNNEQASFKYYYDTGKKGTAMDVTVYFQLHEHNAYGDYISNGDGTHTRRCTVEGCNASETENCSGGTATCKDKAVCEICGEEYGELNPENHAGGTHIEHEKPATCTENGYTGDTYCNGCSEKIFDGSEIPTKPHTPGEKWVIENGKKVKKCTECGAVVDTLKRLPGDVDGDGEITVIDCLYLKRYILGTYSGEIVLENADVDGNGKIDAMDYLYLKRGYLGTFDLSKFA